PENFDEICTKLAAPANKALLDTPLIDMTGRHIPDHLSPTDVYLDFEPQRISIEAERAFNEKFAIWLSEAQKDRNLRKQLPHFDSFIIDKNQSKFRQKLNAITLKFYGDEPKDFSSIANIELIDPTKRNKAIMQSIKSIDREMKKTK